MSDIASPTLNSNLLLAALSVFNTTDSIDEPSIVIQQEVVVRQSKFTSSTSTFFNNKDRFSLSQLLANKKRLLNFSKLGENWNGYDSPPIPQLIIDRVLDIIEELEIQPSIFPTGRGTLQMEFNVPDDNYLELEIGPDNIGFYESKNGEEREGEIDENQLFSIIHAFQQ